LIVCNFSHGSCVIFHDVKYVTVLYGQSATLENRTVEYALF